MKICYVCHRSDVEFNKCLRRKDGFQTHCKGCSSEMSKKYYQDGKAEQILRVRATRKKRARQLYEYLTGRCCIDCKEADPLVLDFDHVRGKKIKAVGVMVGQAFSWKNILKEIAKCEIRCANCHRRKTMKERKQFRWLQQQITPKQGGSTCTSKNAAATKKTPSRP